MPLGSHSLNPSSFSVRFPPPAPLSFNCRLLALSFHSSWEGEVITNKQSWESGKQRGSTSLQFSLDWFAGLDTQPLLKKKQGCTPPSDKVPDQDMRKQWNACWFSHLSSLFFFFSITIFALLTMEKGTASYQFTPAPNVKLKMFSTLTFASDQYLKYIIIVIINMIVLPRTTGMLQWL